MKVEIRPIEEDAPRSCGECSLCCKILAIPEVDSPAGTYCRHAKKGCGCQIYQTRPEPCRVFECLWLKGLVPLAFKPNAIHAVMTTTVDGNNYVIHEDPGYPGVGRRELERFIQLATLDSTHYVVIVTGDKRVAIGDVATIAKKLEEAKRGPGR